MYKLFIRPVFFLFPPERIHYIALGLLKFVMVIPLVRILFFKKPAVESVNVFGLNFPNRVGLAAGFDKNAKYIDTLQYLGFGHIEIGTVTPKPQAGNPKPRLFRLSKDKALINRMGFNNDGVDKVVERLKKRKSNIIIGGNIGKNKVTPNEEAWKDYEICFNKLFDYVDYFVVNVSSPNTPGLRELQEKEPLTKILSGLQEINNKKTKAKPILLKIAPDLTDTQLDEIVEIVQATKIVGIIATNTTLDRSNLKTKKSMLDKIGAGGLSGKPEFDIATRVLKYLHQKSNGNIPLIGVGGIHSPEDAKTKLEAGASLVQIYTGFIYEGPGFVKKLVKSQKPKVNS